MKQLLTVFCLLISFTVSAQTLDDMIGQGKEAMKRGDYEEANLIFRKILTSNKPIPSAFCYYFAETLYQIRQFQNSKNFIEKYFELSGTTGEFYEETMALNEKITVELAAIKSCPLCNDHGYIWEECDHCKGQGDILDTCHYCKGGGKIICPTCMGEGVVIQRNVFNANEYRSCHKCNGAGVLVCPVCHGEKEVSSPCPQCNGLGVIGSSRLCDHPQLNGNN